MIRLIVAALLLCVMTGFADDITTNDGVTYTGIQVVKKTPVGIEVLSGEKAYWVDYRDLPGNVAEKYGYNPDKLKQYEAELQANDGCLMSEKENPDFPPADTGSTPPDSGNTYVYNPTNPVPFNGGYSYVYWNGNYYNWHRWHSWYWHHHWVNHNGRYYPASYYYRHGGVWENGKYYPYHHHRLYSEEHKTPHYVPSHHRSYHGGEEHRGGEEHHGGGEHRGGGGEHRR
jgi:hypothetical protein